MHWSNNLYTGAAAKLDVADPLTENEIRTGNDTRDRKRIGEAESMSRTAIITGASRGIGAAVAERLSKDGFSVVVNYAGSEAEASALVNKITSAGGTRSPQKLTSARRTRFRGYSKSRKRNSEESTSWSTMPASCCCRVSAALMTRPSIGKSPST